MQKGLPACNFGQRECNMIRLSLDRLLDLSIAVHCYSIGHAQSSVETSPFQVDGTYFR